LQGYSGSIAQAIAEMFFGDNQDYTFQAGACVPRKELVLNLATRSDYKGSSRGTNPLALKFQNAMMKLPASLRTGRNGIEITQIAYRVKTSTRRCRRSLTGSQLSLQSQQARDNALAAMKISCPDRAGMYQMNNEYI
jgi:hypothetical protein